MRNCSLIFLLIIIPIIVNAQQKLDSIPKDSVMKVWALNDTVFHAWNKIDSEWMANEYWNILKTFKLKMSCAHCEDILMHVDMAIDSSGKLVEHRVTYSDKCGQEFDKKLEDAFLKYFYEFTFPPALRGRIFNVLLGTGLTC